MFTLSSIRFATTHDYGILETREFAGMKVCVIAGIFEDPS